MRFDSCSAVKEVIGIMEAADEPRSDNRATINKLFNGEAPFDETKAEENNIEINRNFLKGVQVLSDARRQWNQAMLKPGNFFSVRVDNGPAHKRQQWSNTITKHINRGLKKSRKMTEQIRATGASVMLHGIGASIWPDKHTVIPEAQPISSLLIPSETNIDFENLDHFALFQQWTPAQLFRLTHGPKADPGWNMKLVNEQLRKRLEEKTQDPDFDQMPERLEEALKQNLGYYGSDAVATVDAWDFYFREEEDGKGWYRRIVLKNEDKGEEFLYSSDDYCHADNLSEILHCQFGDCSAVAPFKYHSVRSLGWMIWGICDIMNRLQCKFTEAVFENLMWFFRVSGDNELNRLRKANFLSWGVIPQGIAHIPKEERFVPDVKLVEMAFSNYRQHIAENAASYTQDFDAGSAGKEMTATETMARVNSVNSLVSGMMALAYAYEEFKFQEMARRMCRKDSKDLMAIKFRAKCLGDGVPSEVLDSDDWEIQAERVLGAGNKTVEMATIGFLQQIRKNVGPDAQRKIDNISISAATDQPDLADELAPVDQGPKVSDSTHDAELASERLMRGLPFSVRPDMVFEEYVIVWLRDMALMVKQIQAFDNMGEPQTLMGLNNMAQHIQQFLQIMGTNDEEVPKVKMYGQALSQLMNLIRGFEQRLAQKMEKEGAQGGEGAAETAAKVQGEMMVRQVKAQNAMISHGQKTAQKQVSFEAAEAQKDRAAAADIDREQAKAAVELQTEAAKAAIDLAKTKAQAEQAKQKPEED